MLIMKKSLFYYCIILCSLIANIGYGQLSVRPSDTLTCPTQNINLRTQFATDRPTNVGVDDQFGDVLDIGFNFVFYGNTYSQCVLSMNNYITFDISKANSYSSYVYSTAESSNDLTSSIMFPFHDLNPFGIPNNRISYVTVGEPGSRKFIIQFCNVPLFSCSNLLATNQLILYEGSNHIEIHTLNKPGGCTWQNGTAIMGIRSGANADYVPGRNLPNVNWSATNEGLRFVPLTATTYRLDTIPFAPYPIIVDPDYNFITWYKQGSNTPIGTGQNLTVTAEKNVNYYVAVYEGAGTCFDNLTYTFRDTARVRFNNFSSNRTVEICAGQTYNFFGDEIFTTGTYRRDLVTPLGCDSVYVLNLIVNPLPDVTLSAPDQLTICEGQSRPIRLANPKSNYAYQWFLDDVAITGADKEVYSVNKSGKYHVVVTTNKGCVDTSKAVYATVNPSPKAEILGIIGNQKPIYCNYDTITIGAVENSNYEYIWSPDKNFRNFNIVTSAASIKGQFRDPETTVTLVVRDQIGCMDTTSTIIRTQPCCEIFVPNAFTPNNDGLNDYFLPTLKPLQSIVSFVIYDRYGAQVYEWKSKSLGWDGLYPNGDAAPTGTYMYQLIYSCDDGKNYTEKEAVQLIR